MKFSSMLLNMKGFASKLMGISSYAENIIGAINTNSGGSPNSIWETIFTVIKSTAMNAFVTIYEIIMTIIYSIAKWMLTILDFLVIFVREIIGMNSDFSSFDNIIESDMIFQFIFNETVIDVIKGLIAIAIVMIILLSIIALIKSEYDYIVTGGGNSKGQILGNILKSVGMIILVPVIAIGGIMLSNAILKSLYMATAGGADVSVGTQIFISAGHNANAFRRYVKNNQKIPITFNFEEISKTDNVGGWGSETDGVAMLDERLRDFADSDVWNRGWTTFAMFYLNSFENLDDIDYLQEVYKSLSDPVTGEPVTDPYHLAFDNGLYTKAEEYSVMADVVEYSLKNRKTIYFKTMEELFNSYYDTYYMLPEAGREKMASDPRIVKDGDTFTINVHYEGEEHATKYVHQNGATDEAKGAVYLIAVEKHVEFEDKIYTYYYPLMSAEENFVTNYHKKIHQHVIAKGLFEEGQNPTAIKQVDGVVKFYRDNLNIPMLADLFPKISYEKPPEEGTTKAFGVTILKAGISSVLGVDPDQFIPYVYYNFDIFSLFTKSQLTVVQVNNGALLLDYNFSQGGIRFEHTYKMFDFSMFILVWASILLLGMFLKILFGAAVRVVDLTLLAISYPIVVSTMPIDNGKQFSGWVTQFVNKLLSIYGVIVSMNIALLLIPITENLNLITPTMIDRSFNGGVQLASWLTVGMANNLINLLFFLVALSMASRGAKMIESALTNKKYDEVDKKGKPTNPGIIDDGTVVVNDIARIPKTIGKVVTGELIKDVGAKMIETAGGAVDFIPGAAVVRRGIIYAHDKAQDDMMKKDIHDMKERAKKGDTSGFE